MKRTMSTRGAAAVLRPLSEHEIREKIGKLADDLVERCAHERADVTLEALAMVLGRGTRSNRADLKTALRAVAHHYEHTDMSGTRRVTVVRS